MVKKNDIVLIGVVLLLGLVTLFVINIMKSEGAKLVVTINGKEYKQFNLNKDTTFTIEGENGSWNTFEIKNGVVDMIDASCPDKLCVNQGEIHYNYQTIICLPNKVVLEVMNSEDSDVDAVVK